MQIRFMNENYDAANSTGENNTRTELCFVLDKERYEQEYAKGHKQLGIDFQCLVQLGLTLPFHIPLPDVIGNLSPLSPLSPGPKP